MVRGQITWKIESEQFNACSGFFPSEYSCFRVTEPPDLSSVIEPITEERASRTLYRIELLRKIREQVLHHPQLGERLKLCQPSLDLPEWWECGRHDRDLLVGAAKHGVSRTDYHILNDPELSFLDAHKTFAQSRGAGNLSSLTPLAAGLGQPPAAPPSALAQEEKAAGPSEGRAEEGGSGAALEKAGAKGEEEEEEAGSRDRGRRQGCEPEAGSVKSDPRGTDVSADTGPKSISEKGSEEDEEDKLEDDDKSEESSQPEGKAPAAATCSCRVTRTLVSVLRVTCVRVPPNGRCQVELGVRCAPPRPGNTVFRGASSLRRVSRARGNFQIRRRGSPSRGGVRIPHASDLDNDT